MSKGQFRPVGSFAAWSPGHFDAPDAHAADGEDVVVLPTAQEIEAMHEQARAEGHDAGYREGLQQGQAESRALLGLCDALRTEIARLDEAVAVEVATLALAVAQRVIGDAYRQQPELVARLVEQGLHQLSGGLQAVRIQLNPADIALVRAHLGDELASRRISLAPEAGLQRGGCRIRTQSIDIDASLETRWTRVTEVLGGIAWPAPPVVAAPPDEAAGSTEPLA